MQANKTLGMLLIATIFMSMAPMAFADDVAPPTTDPVEEQIQLEIQAMNNSGLGAEIRLLQLAKNIEIKIEIGNLAVTKLQELGENTTELEVILAELELVKQEVEAVDPTAADAVQQFVDLKKDAIELAQDFRGIATAYLPLGYAEQIRAQARIMNRERIDEANQIRLKIREYNKAKMNELQSQHKIQLQEIANKLGTGEINATQARDMIRSQAQTMTQAERFGNYTAIKENALRNTIQARQSYEDVIENYTLRYQERLQNRINNNNGTNGQFGELIQKRIEERLNSSNNGNNNSQQGGNSP